MTSANNKFNPQGKYIPSDDMGYPSKEDKERAKKYKAMSEQEKRRVAAAFDQGGGQS